MNHENGLLLVVSGCAGTGKGTVIAALRSRYADLYTYSVSATTRAPRPGEIDHVHYHFLSQDTFEDAIRHSDMLEYTKYCGNYYGTPKSELQKTADGKHLILEIEVEGAGNVKQIYPEAVTVFIAPPDMTTLEARLRGRGTNTEDDIRARMHRARAELARIPDYDYVVVNEDGGAEQAAEQIHAILCSEQLRTNRSHLLIEKLTASNE